MKKIKLLPKKSYKFTKVKLFLKGLWDSPFIKKVVVFLKGLWDSDVMSLKKILSNSIFIGLAGVIVSLFYFIVLILFYLWVKSFSGIIYNLFQLKYSLIISLIISLISLITAVFIAIKISKK